MNTIRRMLPTSLLAGLGLLSTWSGSLADNAPSLRFEGGTPVEMRSWQSTARQKLYSLMMGGQEPARSALEPIVLRRIEVPEGQYVLEEMTLQTLPDRRAHVWVARPMQPKGKGGAVLAINGHGGNGEQIVRGSGLYWYGRALAEMGYVVIAPDVGQHELQHTNWCLMGERTWDALRCLDYVVTLPEVDPQRLAVAGLSLGGETTMYVAALDERVQVACSSGWLTTVANMKNGHCPCFDFPGLEENFDFSDIFACVAPRRLVCELGEQERAPGGFPVEIGRKALDEIRGAYRVFGAQSNVTLTVHPGPHVFDGRDFWPKLRAVLGEPRKPFPDDTAAAAWIRFSDGPESLDGVPYYWLGRSEFKVDFDVPPQPGDELQLHWGGKGDVRQALLTINGINVKVQDGGHWGFRWIRVPVPKAAKGDHYEIAFRRAEGQPAFLAEIRLVAAQSVPRQTQLGQPVCRARLTVVSDADRAKSAEAFPEMRMAWERPTSAPGWLRGRRSLELFQKAEANGRLANEAFYRCRRFIDGWLAHADPATGLIPRNLGDSRDYWNGRDSAADNYPYMVLTAAITDRPLMEGRLLEMLRIETRLTCRVDRLPDDYSFSKKGWRREKPDLDAIIFDGSEYVKDGLLPITEWLGPSAWAERMIGITDDVWKHAQVETPHGKIPTRNFEVAGDLLQACSRLYWFTSDRKYLEWAARLGDYCLLGTNHPTRDLKQLRLIDHGCEVINGLTELYLATARVWPEKKRQYEQPMHDLFDCILEKGRNQDGLFYSWFNPQTGEHSQDLCDTWGYDYDGVYTMWLVDGTATYREAVRGTLANLKGKYVGACWGEKSADAYADSIEGAINLINREPVQSAAEWIDSQTGMMWAIQKPDGIIEGWHGDGNFARTSLMYALWKTQGVTIEPWRADVRFGAVRAGSALWITVMADRPWEGKLVVDRQRHRLGMRLPLDYPRINQFPEWFTVGTDAKYRVVVNSDRGITKRGSELVRGITLKLEGGEVLLVKIQGL